MADRPDPVTLGDLDPVSYVADDWAGNIVMCDRCNTLVPEVFRLDHTEWHTAIEAAQFGQPSSTAPDNPNELRKWLIEQLTSWYRVRGVTANAAHLARNAMSAFEACGVWPGELNRLRKIESELIKLGAPDRSYRSPGDLVIEWARELVGENKLLREERDRFAAELDAARNEDSL